MSSIFLTSSSSSTFVFERSFCVGCVPSIQMYSANTTMLSSSPRASLARSATKSSDDPSQGWFTPHHSLLIRVQLHRKRPPACEGMVMQRRQQAQAFHFRARDHGECDTC